jgi:hypothetical protein
VRISTGDTASIERLARYLLRSPVALERMRFDASVGEVHYQAKASSGLGPREDTFERNDFLARLLQHVPEPQEGRSGARLVTGANAGLGFEITRVLAARGARVVMACRSKPRADEAIERIRDLTPRADLEFWPTIGAISTASTLPPGGSLQVQRSTCSSIMQA